MPDEKFNGRIGSGTIRSRDEHGQVTKIVYYIPSSEILEFPIVINFDIITSDDINFNFHFLP